MAVRWSFLSFSAMQTGLDFPSLNCRRCLIQSIAKIADGTLRLLDLTDASVRKAVRKFEGGKVSALYQSKHATPYK
jgi:hypothetical protein